MGRTTKPFMYCGDSPAGGKAFCYVEPFRGGARVKFCTEDGTICEENDGISVNVSTVTFSPSYRHQWKDFLVDGTEKTWKADVKIAGIKRASEVILAEYFKAFPEAHEKIRIKNKEYSTGGVKKRKTTTAKSKAATTSVKSGEATVGGVGGGQSSSSATIPLYEVIGLTAKAAIIEFMQGDLLPWATHKESGIKIADVLRSAFRVYGLELDLNEALSLSKDKFLGVIETGTKYKRIGHLFENLEDGTEAVNRLSDILSGGEEPPINKSSRPNSSTMLTNTQSTRAKDGKNARKAEAETISKDTNRPSKRPKRQNFDPTHLN